MKLKQKLLKGGGQLAAGQVLTQGASLCRNILLARLLVPESFGLATTFMLTLSMLEMLSNVSAEMLLVQSKDGGTSSYLRALHGFILIRGVVVSFLIFFLAEYIADLFHAPQITWAFQLLALAPLIKAFVHLEYKQAQRKYDYTRELWVEVLPQIGAAILLYPLFLVDNSAVLGLWVVLSQVAMFVLVSHIVAYQPYRVSFDIDVYRDVLKFGIPLVASAFLMFFAVQGDRFFIGHYYTAQEFGVFSAISLLVMNASNAIAKLSTSLMLPVLARSDRHLVVSRLRSFDLINLLFAGVLAFLMFVLGDAVILLLYGQSYNLPGLVGAFAFLFLFRLMRFPITVYYISKGNTVVPLLANLIRFFGVLIAFRFAYVGGEIKYVVLSGALGEFLAYLVARLISMNAIGDIFRSIVLPFMFGLVVVGYYSGMFL